MNELPNLDTVADIEQGMMPETVDLDAPEQVVYPAHDTQTTAKWIGLQEQSR